MITLLLVNSNKKIHQSITVITCNIQSLVDTNVRQCWSSLVYIACLLIYTIRAAWTRSVALTLFGNDSTLSFCAF